MNKRVTEVFNTGTEAFYRVRIDYSPLVEQWTKEAKMNEERFEEFKYHSGLVAQGSWDELDDYDRAAIIRFGDLIVKECLSIAVAGNATAVVDVIKERFGVEK